MFHTKDQAKEMIIQTIEDNGKNSEAYDINQISDAVIDHNEHGYFQAVNQDHFWAEVELAEWDGEYKKEMSRQFPEDEDDIYGAEHRKLAAEIVMDSIMVDKFKEQMDHWLNERSKHIHQSHKAGMPVTHIARAAKLSRNTIYKILDK